MINENDIILVHCNIVIDYKGNNIQIEIMNNYFTIMATRISKKGYIIQESIAINRDKHYHNAINFVNEQEKIILSLLERLKKKDDEHDEKIVDM